MKVLAYYKLVFVMMDLDESINKMAENDLSQTEIRWSQKVDLGC